MDTTIYASLSMLAFSLVTLTPWFIEGSRQIFFPIKIWSAMQVALIIPAAILISINPNFLHRDVLRAVVSDPNLALFNALICYSIMNAFSYLSYYMILSPSLRGRSFYRVRPYPENYDRLAIFNTYFTLGVVLFFVKIQYAGGISFLFDNVSQRVQLQSGLGPLNYLIDILFTVSLIIAIRRYVFYKRSVDLFFVLFVIMTIATSSTLFGGRKVTFQIIISALIIISIYKPTSFIFSLKAFIFMSLLYIAGIVYFFAVLAYRDIGIESLSEMDFPTLIEESFGSLYGTLMSLSYLDNYIYIVSVFNSDNYYYGETFKDIFSAFLPSLWFPDKPPVDDGLYVRFSTMGYRLEPGTPAASLIGYASWPPETLGAAYMNGGIVLVPIFGMLLGAVIAFVTKFARERPNSLFWTVILCNVILNFEISNLRIVTLLTTAFIAFIILAPLRLLLRSTLVRWRI